MNDRGREYRMSRFYSGYPRKTRYDSTGHKEERRVSVGDRRNPVRFLGRPLKPFLLGMCLTMLIIGQANWRSMDRGIEPPLSWFLAGIALTSSGALFYGWWTHRVHLIEAGLLLVAGVYMTRTAFVMLASPFDQAAFFSLVTVLMAGGAYIREYADRPHGERRE